MDLMQQLREIQKDVAEMKMQLIILQNYDQDILTAKDAAKFLRIGLTSFYALCKEKDFPSIKIHNKILVPKESLIKWINKNNNNFNF